MRLTLKDDGYPFRKIMRGKTWIGRTYKAADGTYTCQIHGKPVFTGAASHNEAFREGGSRYLGAANADALAAANAAVSRQRRQSKARAADLARRMMSRDAGTRNAAFDQLFRNMKGEA